jgi:hypothetical protein
MTNGDHLSADAIEALMDKRILLLQDGLELRLTKTVDAQLKDRFDTAVKLLGWTFGLVAIVFTLFGIKTAIDLREAAKTTAIEEVKRKLAIDDPNSDFRRDVDRVIARGLINSYFLEIARNRGKLFAPDIVVSDLDNRRLVDLITDPRSEERDFRDAVDVLVRSQQIKENNYIEQTMVSIANGADEKYKWIGDQQDKRATLLELFPGDKLTPTARKLLSDERANKRLLIAAIGYLGKEADKESVMTLEKIAKTPDEDIANASVLALARIAPASKVVAKAIVIPAQPTGDTIVGALRIAERISESSPRHVFDEDPDQSRRLNLAALVVGEVIERGYVFRLMATPSDSSRELAISTRGNMSTQYGLPSRLLIGSGSQVFSVLLRNAIDDAHARDIVRALCLDDGERCNGVIHMTLSPSAKVRLGSGRVLGPADAPAGIFLRARSPAANSDILASWTDRDLVRQTAVLDRIIDAKQATFEVKSITTISEASSGDE